MMYGPINIIFYNKYIPHLADVADPLNQRDEICVRSRATGGILSLQKYHLTAPFLEMANFSEKFILQTDASGASLGAVLSQERKGSGKPVRMLPQL